jgi:hypothetical protein
MQYNPNISALTSQPHGNHAILTGHSFKMSEDPTIDVRYGSHQVLTKGPSTSPRLPMAEGHTSVRMESDGATQAQEDLQDAREDLLGFRFALRSRRKELTRLRQETGEVEGAIFSYIQKVFHDNRIPFSDELLKDYHRLDTLKDRLGFSEVEYDEEEQKYNGLEYEYTQKESSFIDTRVNRISPSAPKDRYQQNYATEDLTKFAEGPNGIGAHTICYSQESSNHSGLETVRHNHSNQSQDHDANGGIESLSSRRSHDPNTIKGTSSLPQLSSLHGYLAHTEAPSVSNSESALQYARKHWPDTLRRIDLWILDAIKCSPLQKAFLKNVLSEAGLNDPLWWELVLKYWSSTEYDNFPPPIDDSHLSMDDVSMDDINTSLGRGQM